MCDVINCDVLGVDSVLTPTPESWYDGGRRRTDSGERPACQSISTRAFTIFNNIIFNNIIFFFFIIIYNLSTFTIFVINFYFSINYLA